MARHLLLVEQSNLLEQSNRQSIMTFNLLRQVFMALSQRKEYSSPKRSRTENEADGDQADKDEAHSEKKQTVSSAISPTFSLLNPLLTPGFSASLFPLPHSSVGQLFAQQVAVHSPCSPIPLAALVDDRDLNAERNKYLMASRT